MNTFLHDFVMKTIKEMIGKDVEEYRVRQYALGWYEKQVLDLKDLEQIEIWLAEREQAKAVVEEPVQEPIEEVIEENAQDNTEEEIISEVEV